MSDHTGEPWEWDEEEGTIEAAGGGGIAIMHRHGNVNTIARTGETYSKADARRIVACVNACAGVPTEMLERRPIKALVDGTACWHVEVRIAAGCKATCDAMLDEDEAREKFEEMLAAASPGHVVRLYRQVETPMEIIEEIVA